MDCASNIGKKYYTRNQTFFEAAMTMGKMGIKFALFTRAYVALLQDEGMNHGRTLLHSLVLKKRLLKSIA